MKSRIELDLYLNAMVDSIGYVNINLAAKETGLLPITLKAAIRRLGLASNKEGKYLGVWTKGQVEALKENYHSLSHYEIGKLIGQNECYVKTMCKVQGLKGKKRVSGSRAERKKYLETAKETVYEAPKKIVRPPAEYSNKTSLYGIEY